MTLSLSLVYLPLSFNVSVLDSLEYKKKRVKKKNKKLENTGYNNQLFLAICSHNVNVILIIQHVYLTPMISIKSIIFRSSLIFS